MIGSIKYSRRPAIFSALLLLSTCGHLALTCRLFAQENAMTVEELDPQTRQQYEALRAKLEQGLEAIQEAEQRAYRDDPLLKKALDGLREARELEAKAGRLRTQVKRYYEEKDAEAGKLYRQWDTLYGEVEGEELFEQWAKDPELVPFLVPYFAAFAKDIANDDPGVSNLPSDEAFDRYLQMARENRNQKLEEYRALEAKLSPPDFVVEFAKTREKANLLFGIYDAYVRKNTPDYVSIARNESKEISNQLTQLWPNWEKVEESAELKAREESRIHGSALNQPFKSWALIAINVVFVAGLVLIIAWRRWRGQRKM